MVTDHIRSSLCITTTHRKAKPHCAKTHASVCKHAVACGCELLHAAAGGYQHRDRNTLRGAAQIKHQTHHLSASRYAAKLENVRSSHLLQRARTRSRKPAPSSHVRGGGLWRPHGTRRAPPGRHPPFCTQLDGGTASITRSESRGALSPCHPL